MFREQHILVYRSGEEGKLVWNFTPKQFGWIALGTWISITAIQMFPKLPIRSVWGYIPHVFPLLLALVLAFGKHTTTGMSLFMYIVSWIKIRRRKRIFLP